MKNTGTVGIFIVLVFLLSVLTSASASGPIELFTETGEINKLKFVNYENFYEPAGQKNDMVNAGDWYEGIFKVQSISNISGSKDLTAQLNDIELTGHFKFSVVGDASRPMFGSGHNDYALLETGGGGTQDFIRFYTGSGALMNWDPSQPDAIARATDGDLWLEILPSEFFEGVNDAFNASYNFAESWADVTTNNTGYTILPQLYPAIFDPHAYYSGHTYEAESHNSHTSDIYFQNHTSGSDILRWQIRSEDPVYMAVAPEPLSAILFVIGGVTLGMISYRKKKALV